MEKRVSERESQAFNSQEYLTPVKGCQDGSIQQSTTAHLGSHEPFSFEKLMQRQKLAVKYCSANLNELLGSDIKFKSPAVAMKVQAATPARHDWDGSAFFDLVQEYDSAAKIIANKLNLDMTIRKDSLTGLKLREEDLLKDASFCVQPSFEFNNPYRNEFHIVEDVYNPRPYYSFKNSAQNHYYPPGQTCSNAEDMRKRKRKNNVQLKILKNEFSKGDCWNKEKIYRVAQITGLSESQVYKWCWDQKKKVEEQENFRPDSGKIKLESQLRAALMDLEDDDLSQPSECQSSAEHLSKRKPDREPFGFLNKNRF